MNPCLFHTAYLRDGSGQFPLQSSLIVKLLHKFRHSEIFPVKNFESNSAPLRKTLGSHREPEFIDLVGGHHHPLPVRHYLVRHLAFLEFFYNLTCVLT